MVVEIQITDLSNKIQKITTFTPNEVTFGEVIEGGNGKRVRVYSENSEDDSIISSIHPRKKKPQIPDGGFGWVVVFASLCVSLIQDGCSFSFGLIYVELLDEFQESKAKTACIGSLFMAVPLLVGPIMSNLVDRYGCRKMTILGGFLSCLGFVLASISPSIEMLYLTFGIIAGLGLGLGYVTAVVSIAFWFDKKRTFATGIGASGTGIGTFLYAPFTQWLIEYFGWRGATLILAGTLLNICVCGALMRDPEWLIEENALESRSQSMQTFSNSSVCLDEIKKLIETGAAKEDILDTLMTNVNTETNQQILRIPEEMVTQKKYQSEMVLPTFMDPHHQSFGSRKSLKLIKALETKTSILKDPKPILASSETLNSYEKVSSCDDFDHFADLDGVSLESVDEGYLTCKRSRMGSSRFSLDENYMNKDKCSMDENMKRSLRGVSLDAVHENEIFNPVSMSVTLMVPRKEHQRRPKKSNLAGAKLSRHNSSLKYSHYLNNVRMHRNSIHYRGALLNTHRYRLKASSCPDIYRNSMTTITRENEEKWYDDFVDSIKSMFDFSLFMNYKFAMMSFSTLILFVWFIIPYFYITEYLLKFGYQEEDGANLISVIGVFNTFGMVFLGWLGDQPWCDVSKTYAYCLVACGLSTLLMPLFILDYWMLVVLCSIFGVTFASSFSFTPIILVRLVNLDDFTCAYGLMLLVQGVGSLVGPPLAGIIYDITGRWDDSFYAAGFFIIISGILAYLIGSLDPTPENEESTDE